MKVYFDIDTQIDFLFPAGALYVPGAEKLVPTIAKLNREAVESGAKLISTACAHSEDDAEFKVWAPHCVLGTVGQTKPVALLTGSPSQIVLEKQELDLFSNPKTEELLREFGPSECVVYGVVTEYCVKKCSMGLLERGFRVTLVENAVQTLNAADSNEFLHAFRRLGGCVLAG
jgi:nicotinamidase/pyrazinamidase